MKNIYLIFAIVGAVVPYLFFISFFANEGFAPATFLATIFANGAAGGATADLLISSAVFWSYLIAKHERNTWVYILLNLTIGLSCALPAYLYMKARAAEQPATT